MSTSDTHVVLADARPRRLAARAPIAAAVVAGVAVVAAAAVNLSGCGLWQESSFGPASGAPARPDDHDPSSLVPAGVQTVIDVNLAALRQSAWTASLLEGPDSRARAARAEALGYDDVADLDRIIYAVTAAGGDAPTLVVAQGRLRAARIADAFRARWPGAVADHWRGILVLVSGENAIALVTDRTFASGPPAAVRAVVDRAFGVGADLGADPALGPTRRALNPEGPDVQPAVLATIAIDARIRSRVGETAFLPPQLRQVGLRLDLGQSLDLRALGILDDRDAAAALARRITSLLGGPLTYLGLRAMGLEFLLAQTRVTAEGARVLARTSVSEDHRPEVVAALRSAVEALRGGGGPGGFRSW